MLAFLSLSAAFMLGACSSMSRQEFGTFTGAAVGVAAGSIVGGPMAVIGGAVVGGVVGHEVSKK
jgi:osmotically inducible lipoprotein OsmB